MLYRTASFLSLSDYDNRGLKNDRLFPALPSSATIQHLSVPGYALLPQRKGQEDHGRSEFKHASDMAPSKASSYSQPKVSSVRYTSPLCPVQKLLPPRPIFPRARPKPNLYRTALKQMAFNSLKKEETPRTDLHPVLRAIGELRPGVSAHENDEISAIDDALQEVNMKSPMNMKLLWLTSPSHRVATQGVEVYAQQC